MGGAQLELAFTYTSVMALLLSLMIVQPMPLTLLLLLLLLRLLSLVAFEVATILGAAAKEGGPSLPSVLLENSFSFCLCCKGFSCRSSCSRCFCCCSSPSGGSCCCCRCCWSRPASLRSMGWHLLLLLMPLALFGLCSACFVREAFTLCFSCRCCCCCRCCCGFTACTEGCIIGTNLSSSYCFTA